MLSLKLIQGLELAEGVAEEMRLPEPLTRFSIGRDPSNQWPIPDRTRAISSRHCEIVATGAGPALRDVSTNGTFVNGGDARLAGAHLLHDGDRIEMGPFVILVQNPRGADAVSPGRGILVDLPVQAPPPPPPPPPSPPPLAAPLRGGDPAAMFASGSGPARVGLTQILLDTPKDETWNGDVTRIRAAPRADRPPPQAPLQPLPMPPLPSTVQPPPSPAPSPAPPPCPSSAPTEFIPRSVLLKALAAQPVLRSAPAHLSGAPWQHLLAAGLGLAPNALDGHDLAQLAFQVGTLLRTGLATQRQLLDHQEAALRGLSASFHPPPTDKPA